MKILLPKLIAGLLALFSLNAAAETHYVDLTSPSPTPPYTNWVTAATNIQDAIDAAVDGDSVLVTNGVYATGGKVIYGTLTNRVAIDKALNVQSLNGPTVTMIEGGGVMRCVYLTNGSALAGFTLTNGTADSGGGAWCESVTVGVSNCVIVGNSASGGGGVQGGTLNNCILDGNSAGWVGGGAQGSVLNNCLLTNNSSYFAGAAAEGALSNCTVLNNYAGADSAVAEGSTFENCILSGNYSTIEGLTAWYCTFNNCTLVGNSAGVAHCNLNNSILYYDGENSGVNTFNYSCTTPLPVGGVGNITSAPLFRDQPGGDFRLQTNSQCINAGKNIYVSSSVDLDGNPRIVDGNVDMGAYEFQQIRPRVVRYVDVNSFNPALPYTNWATAAVTIQDAIDVAYHGDLILVTNGIYGTGGRAVYDTMTNRVAVDRRLVLQSVNGPEFTFIEGYQVPGTVYGDSAIRCVYLTEDALLSGFTLTNGATRDSGDYETQMYGGGLWCEASGALVSNCVVTGNSAISAGGAYRGTLTHCVISGNLAADAGGGAFVSKLNNCLITSNSAGSYGGGAYGTMRGCIIAHNFARYSAGANGYLQNCTVVSNTASALGGGAEESELNNCIVYYNSDRNGANTSSSTLNFSCTPTGGNGNITNEPMFVNLAAGDYRLQPNSPCINAGKNSFAPVSLDLDDNPRIAGGTVDIGAYEFQSPSSVLSYAWAQQYGLPTDGSADFTDADADGANNWQEWRADTNPTNALSVLRMVSATNSASGLDVTWQSVATRNYWLERATNLGDAPPFQSIATNIAGASGTTTYTDTNATNGWPYFYRVGVQ